MRVALATALAFALCSCHHPTAGGWTRPHADAEPADEGYGAQRIAVGDTMDEVAQRIVAAGGEDISRCIGFIDYPRLSSWYILKDGTCLQVTPAATSEAGRDVVGRLTLGEPGRGFGAKFQWLKQRHREVTAIELR